MTEGNYSNVGHRGPVYKGLGAMNPCDLSNRSLSSSLCSWYREGRLPKEVLKWRPSGRRKRGRPKLTWAEGIRGIMEEKGLREEDWNDRREWRKKIM
jgi:hypothetical protein